MFIKLDDQRAFYRQYSRGGGGRNRNNVTKVIHDDVKFKSIKDYYAFTSYNSPLKHFMPRDT